VAVHGLVDTPIYKNDLATLFWIVAAVQVAAIAALAAPATRNRAVER
jgi:hypothetical protein